MGPDDDASSAAPAEGSTTPRGERVLGGRYRLGATLGSGAYTKSFDAVDVTDDVPVVVKMLPSQFGASASFMERFHADLQMVSELDHPNIARLVNFGVEEVGAKSYPYLVTEQFAGGSLRGMLDRGRQLSASQVLLVGLDVCRGLAFAHAKGIVHGAITPSNLLFGTDRKVRIADFGISRLLGDIRWSNPGRIDIDSARYASPEHALGLPIESRSDIYSLCLTLVESVTGQVPFAADTAVSTLSARLDKLMPVSADLGALASVLERAGRPVLEDRYTAIELGRALVAAAEKMPRPEPIALIGLGRFGDTTATLPTLGDGPSDDSLNIMGAMAAVPTNTADTEAGPDLDPMTLLALLPDASDESLFGSLPAIQPGPSGDVLEEAPRENQGGTYEDEYTAGTYSADSVVSDPAHATNDDDAYYGATEYPGQIVGEVGAEWVPEPVPVRRTATVEIVEGDDDILNIDRRGVLRFVAVAVALVAAAVLGVIGFRWLSTPSHEVPNLIGASEAEAANILASNGWDMDVRRVRDDTQAQGNVVSTEPVAGERLKEGESLTLVVSDGPTLSKLPDVANLTLEEARTQLTALGLVLRESKTEPSDTVPAGSVISWAVAEEPTLAAGSQVPKGTTVEVVVSAGSAVRTVPNLVGRTLEEARADLEAAGLVAGEVVEQASTASPPGTVISSNPTAGASVPVGATVNLTIVRGTSGN